MLCTRAAWSEVEKQNCGFDCQSHLHGGSQSAPKYSMPFHIQEAFLWHIGCELGSLHASGLIYAESCRRFDSCQASVSLPRISIMIHTPADVYLIIPRIGVHLYSEPLQKIIRNDKPCTKIQLGLPRFSRKCHEMTNWPFYTHKRRAVLFPKPKYFLQLWVIAQWDPITVEGSICSNRISNPPCKQRKQSSTYHRSNIQWAYVLQYTRGRFPPW